MIIFGHDLVKYRRQFVDRYQLKITYTFLLPNDITFNLTDSSCIFSHKSLSYNQLGAGNIRNEVS